ncbi:uncharacterized protein LOC117928092 isoform X9 [Vitis riparia]|uniref:uncharacterized protein LOC117928092 isoform X9 n=1 Tax=Vitis riparia TaxID=96939 RepID=UPI00155A4E36|nr:uncharacterized protein LOC117928092 isoform X9 [Vitis riparia]
MQNHKDMELCEWSIKEVRSKVKNYGHERVLCLTMRLKRTKTFSKAFQNWVFLQNYRALGYAVCLGKSFGTIKGFPTWLADYGWLLNLTKSVQRLFWCLNGDWWLEVDVKSPRPKNIWMLYSLYRLFTSPLSCMALGYALLHRKSLGMVEVGQISTAFLSFVNKTHLLDLEKQIPTLQPCEQN